MIAFSTITATLILFGFLVNRQVPFEIPISLLIHLAHPWVYPAILLCMGATLTCYAWRRSRPAGPARVALPGSIVLLLVFLIFVDARVQPTHDNVSAFLMFLSSIYLWHLADELGPRYLKGLVAVSFLTLPLVFTGNLTAIAIVELILITWSLILLNLAYYYGPACDPIAAARTLRDLFRSGSRLRGYTWAVYCVFFCGLAGVYAHSRLAGVFHFALCWCAGYLSKKCEYYPFVDYLLFLASGVGFLLLVPLMAEIALETLIVPVLFLVGAVVTAAIYRTHEAGAGA